MHIPAWLVGMYVHLYISKVSGTYNKTTTLAGFGWTLKFKSNNNPPESELCFSSFSSYHVMLFVFVVVGKIVTQVSGGWMYSFCMKAL